MVIQLIWGIGCVPEVCTWESCEWKIFFFFFSCTKYLPSLAPNLFLMYVTTVGYYIFNNIFHL